HLQCHRQSVLDSRPLIIFPSRLSNRPIDGVRRDIKHGSFMSRHGKIVIHGSPSQRLDEESEVPAIERFDDVVLGGGKGGKSLAMALAGAGHKVALIERGQIGGTCINVACIPTKTMVASAKLADLIQQADSFGIDATPASPSIRGVIERKRRVV